MDKVIEQAFYSLDAMADDAEEGGQQDRARLLRTCGQLMWSEHVRLVDRVERLRGGLKSASGRFFDIGELGAAEDCMEWAGDMEPNDQHEAPINFQAQGPRSGPAGAPSYALTGGKEP